MLYTCVEGRIFQIEPVFTVEKCVEKEVVKVVEKEVERIVEKKVEVIKEVCCCKDKCHHHHQVVCCTPCGCNSGCGGGCNMKIEPKEAEIKINVKVEEKC
ncbi:hypothetical protein LPJ64_002362 [Coemansia asiatica]|uniref:Uncharacterized protein n=1 Tax=Coemansia asiatica TaxID=1052880 RepID=A0A9W7XJS1_9FUNG|nr:hypothetical protein LPJ64_002362 [Coemansia asiatica]